MTARIPDDLRAEIARAYAEGRTSASLAREYGVSETTVRRFVLDHGGEMRPRHYPPPVDDLAYEGGWVRDGLVWRPTGRRAS